jgi:hypothetical protein
MRKRNETRQKCFLRGLKNIYSQKIVPDEVRKREREKKRK